MATRIQMGKDVNGKSTFDFPFSTITITFTLTASTVATVVVPPLSQMVVFGFTADDDVFVSLNSTATLPTANNYILLENGVDSLLLETAGTNHYLLEGFNLIDTNNQTLNPERRFVKPLDRLSFISTSAANVNLQFYTKTSPTLSVGGW